MKARNLTITLSLLTIYSVSYLHANPFNRHGSIESLCNFFGCFADIFISKGNLSPQNQQLFEQVARSLYIEKQKIKAQNAGTLLRLSYGYHTPVSSQRFHRVYINDSWLNELPENQKRFIIAQTLLYHRNEHGSIAFCINQLLRLISKANSNNANNGFIMRYLTTPWSYNPRGGFFSQFNIYSFLQAQVIQALKRDLDRDAVLVAELNPDDGIALMDAIYKPDTKNWPVYAQLQIGIYRTIIEPIGNLPIMKQHCLYHASQKDRVEHLRSLKDKWIAQQQEYQT